MQKLFVKERMERAQYARHLKPNERIVYKSVVVKRQNHIYSKSHRRILVYTDRGTLLYFDPSTMELKGSIEYSSSAGT